MTNQHRATDKQWAQIKKMAPTGDYSSCIIELRDRIQQLEAAQHTHDRYAGRPSNMTDAQRKAAAAAAEAGARCAIEQLRSKPGSWRPAEPATQHAHPPSPAADTRRMLALQDQIRDGALSLADAVKEIGAPDPAPSPQPPTLVERVANALYNVPLDSDAKARAVIREVAAWLNERDIETQNNPCCLEAPTADDAARWLEHESNR